jgi:invasion protein IalB
MNNWIKAAVLGVVALAVGVGLGWAIRGVATYPVNSQTIATFEDWRIACPPASTKDQSCRMIEQVMDTRTGQSVVQLALGTEKGKNVMDVSVPLGVLLPAGIGLAFDDQKDPKIFQFRTCTTAGCIGHLEVDDKTRAAFGTAKGGKILVAGMDGKAVAIPISLKGYKDAERAFRSAEARRTSWVWRMFS